MAVRIMGPKFLFLLLFVGFVILFGSFVGSGFSDQVDLVQQRALGR